MRAILESIVFRIHQLFEVVKKEIGLDFKLIRFVIERKNINF